MVLLSFAGLLAYGANSTALSLLYAGAVSATAVVLLVFAPWARERASVGWPLKAAAVTFSGLLGWVLFTLAPVSSVWAHPDWGVIGDVSPALTLDRFSTWVELLKLLGCLAAAVIGWMLARSEGRAKRFFEALLAVAALYATWSIASFLVDPTTLFGAPKPYHQGRLTASFYSATTAGGVFGVFSALSWIWMLQLIRRRTRGYDFGLMLVEAAHVSVGIRLGATLLFLLTLLLTRSYAALLATGLVLVLAVGVTAFDMARERGSPLGAAAAAGLGAASLTALLTALAVQPNLARGQMAVGDDLGRRLVMSEVYLDAAQAAPLTGYGLGVFRAVNAAVGEAATFPVTWELGAAHNVIIQWWLEGGLIGLTLAGATVGLLVWALAMRLMGRGRGAWRAAAALAATVVLLLHNLVDYSLQVPAVTVLWSLLLGWGAAAAGGSGGRSRSGNKG
jgi:O-antigen ligase